MASHLHAHHPLRGEQIPKDLKVEVEERKTAQQAIASPHLAIEKGSNRHITVSTSQAYRVILVKRQFRRLRRQFNNERIAGGNYGYQAKGLCRGSEETTPNRVAQNLHDTGVCSGQTGVVCPQQPEEIPKVLTIPHALAWNRLPACLAAPLYTCRHPRRGDVATACLPLPFRWDPPNAHQKNSLLHLLLHQWRSEALSGT